MPGPNSSPRVVHSVNQEVFYYEYFSMCPLISAIYKSPAFRKLSSCCQSNALLFTFLQNKIINLQSFTNYTRNLNRPTVGVLAFVLSWNVENIETK